MAINLSVGSMVKRVKERFAVPAVGGVLTFAAAAAAIWYAPERELVSSGTPEMILMLAAFCGLCFSVMGTLLSESVAGGKRRALFAGAGLLLGAGLYCLLSGFTLRIDMCAGLSSAAFLMCCALIARGEKPRLSLAQALSCLIGCAAVAGLIMLILILLIEAVLALLAGALPFQVSNRLLYTAMAVAAFLAAPFLVFAFLPDAETAPEKHGGLRKVLAWVILPAYLALLAVLLIYIVTILISWTWPVGRMNPYAMLAVGTFAALHLLLTGEENRLSRLFHRYGAWLMLPVIFAQAVAVYIRVDAYGLTAWRILGIAFSAVCLIPVAAALLRRYGRAILPVSAVLILVLTVTPLSAGNLARHSQEGRLFSALSHAGMLGAEDRILPNPQAEKRDREIIWSSAEYLESDRSNVPAGSRTAELLSQLDATAEEGEYYYFSRKARALFGFENPNMNWLYRTERAEGSSSGSELDVAGFSHARLLYLTLDQDKEWRADADGDTVTLDDVLPLADFEAGTITQSDLLLPSGRTLRINYLNRRTRKNASGDEEITDYTLSAWLLTP